MKKILMSIVLTFVFSAYGFACTMPELHGLKPGMTSRDVRKLLDKKFLFLTKSAEFRNMPEVTYLKTTKINGTQSVIIAFYNEVVYSVMAIYDETVKSRSFSDFAEASSKNLQLSDIKWNYMDSKYKSTSKESAKHAVLYCGNFRLFVTGAPTYALQVMNMDTFRSIENLSRLRLETENRTNMENMVKILSKPVSVPK